LQAVRQAAAPLHRYAPHGCVGTAQFPPLQVPASFNVPVVAGQVAAAHDVPSAYFWQPPAPSHFPFVPHEAAPLLTQTPRGSAAPAATGAQVPTLPATLQAWHAPQALLPQQTPSAQWVLAHWPFAVQAAPAIPLTRQLPPGPVQ
jgi:hypothetical protein